MEMVIKEHGTDEVEKFQQRIVQIKKTVRIATKIGFKMRSVDWEGRITLIFFRCSRGHKQIIAPGYLTSKVKCSRCDKSDSGLYLRSLEKKAEKYDFILLTRIYINSRTAMDFLCGHDWHIRITSSKQFRSNPFSCRPCARTCGIQASINFRINVEKKGGRVDGIYINALTKVRCICINGHICFPIPSYVNQDGGICRRCVGRCPIYAEERFFEIMKISKCNVRGKYYGASINIDIICQAGHACYPQPRSILEKNRMVCMECNGTTPETSEKRFNKYLSDSNFTTRSNSKYNGDKKKVKIKCPKGHKREITPSKVHQYGLRCKKCDGHISFLEKITIKALDRLGIDYETQVVDPNIVLLRFDFMFVSNGKRYYVEVDGEQHQGFHEYFHGDQKGFEFSRQRDLIKNYVVLTSENLRLIRLPHTMFLDRKPENREKLINDIAEYIRGAIKLNAKIVADLGMYPWINDEPDEEFQYRYMKSKQNLIINL